MMVRILMRVGFPVTFFASSNAVTISFRLLDPSLTSRTCQPSARNLADVSSVKQLSMEPSTVIELLS